LKKIDRTGEEKIMNCGKKAKIIKYRNATDIDVEFESGYISKHKTYGNFLNGKIVDKSIPNVQKYGFKGDSKTVDDNNKVVKSYQIWQKMMQRCYDIKFHEKQPTYSEVTVCKEWASYENFEEWFVDNYYEIEGETMCLDKDILFKNNTIYSPETCVFVPQRINCLFTKRQNDRGNYYIGVSYHKKIGKFNAKCSTLNERKHIGYYNTELEAFFAYKKFKESYIKDVAEEYKNKIPEKLYNAMIKYEVNIDD
jgi:hypothetical protein